MSPSRKQRSSAIASVPATAVTLGAAPGAFAATMPETVVAIPEIGGDDQADAAALVRTREHRLLAGLGRRRLPRLHHDRDDHDRPAEQRERARALVQGEPH